MTAQATHPDPPAKPDYKKGVVLETVSVPHMKYPPEIIRDMALREAQVALKKHLRKMRELPLCPVHGTPTRLITHQFVGWKGESIRILNICDECRSKK